MSTKAAVYFAAPDGDILAAVYLHFSGYDAGSDVRDFLAAVARAAAPDARAARFHDPSYLAARFIAWKTGGDLLALGVGVMIPGRVHVNRQFTVRCHDVPSLALPDVTEDP